MSPSRLYVALLRHGIANRWDLSQLDLHYPAARFKLGVDLHPSPLLGIEVLRCRVGGVSVRHRRAS